MPLPADRYLSSVQADSVAIADAARGGLDTAVPSCPEWTVEQLVSHLGSVHQWARELVSRRATERLSRRDLAPAPEGAAVVDWFVTGAESLAAALRDAGPDAAVWNW